LFSNDYNTFLAHLGGIYVNMISWKLPLSSESERGRERGGERERASVRTRASISIGRQLPLSLASISIGGSFLAANE
jgi:hypothetical protein